MAANDTVQYTSSFFNAGFTKLYRNLSIPYQFLLETLTVALLTGPDYHNRVVTKGVISPS